MRILLAIAALVGAVALIIPPHQERQLIKTTVPWDFSGAVLPLHDLLEMPSVPGVSMRDARYEDRRIPGTQEGVLVKTWGWLRLVAREPDGDYHIQLAMTPRGMSVAIIEVPEPEFVSAGLRPRFAATRTALDKLLGHAPSVAGIIPASPVQQCWEGVLFYDDAHVGCTVWADEHHNKCLEWGKVLPRGKREMVANSLWELHPAWLCEMREGGVQAPDRGNNQMRPGKRGTYHRGPTYPWDRSRGLAAVE